jgi:ligand-binding SRPBCC domain-containing protein
MHELVREQHFPVSQDTLWEFISRPENLDRITPPDMRFSILSPLPETMYTGLLIRYRIGLPMFGTREWVTEIKHIREGIAFVDEQRFGPYRFWYHYHEIREEDGHAVMRDIVHYRLPFGVLGRLVHALVVRRMLGNVFDFRREKMAELFGTLA